MKKFFLLLFLCFGFVVSAQNQEVSLLTYPSEWRFEHISFPLDFAPNINWKGFEELRFSPSMFKKKSTEYFTYYFALQIEGKKKLTAQDLETFLTQYYRGLSKAVNKNNKFKIDYSNITAKVIPLAKNSFKADIVFYDPFTDGKKVDLVLNIIYIELSNSLKMYASVTTKENVSRLKGLHSKKIKNNISK